jgi:hypothetical protein
MTYGRETRGTKTVVRERELSNETNRASKVVSINKSALSYGHLEYHTDLSVLHPVQTEK